MIQHFTPGLERTFSPGLIGYEKSKEDFSYGIEYNFRKILQLVYRVKEVIIHQ